MDPEQDVWVYYHEYDSDDKVAVDNKRGGPVKRKELNEWLSNHPNWQATTKEITSRNTEVYQCDLLTPEQREEWKTKPNFKQNRASVMIPVMKWYSKNRPTELTIISLDPKKAPSKTTASE